MEMKINKFVKWNLIVNIKIWKSLEKIYFSKVSTIISANNLRK